MNKLKCVVQLVAQKQNVKLFLLLEIKVLSFPSVITS